jgi:hypothetical protein
MMFLKHEQESSMSKEELLAVLHEVERNSEVG